MNKTLLVLLSVTTVCFASLSHEAVPVWPEAKIDVQADQPHDIVVYGAPSWPPKKPYPQP